MPHSKGFRNRGEKRTPEAVPLGRILEGLMSRKEFSAGAGIGKLMSSWEGVVGERLAAETAPGGLEGGVLLVLASDGAWAAQVRFLAEEIRTNANRLLGSEAVGGVRVTVRRAL